MGVKSSQRNAAEETLIQRDAVRHKMHHPEPKTICYSCKALFIKSIIVPSLTVRLDFEHLNTTEQC